MPWADDYEALNEDDVGRARLSRGRPARLATMVLPTATTIAKGRGMELFIAFIGRAEPLAEHYEGLGAASFVVHDLVQRNVWALVVPNIGDRLLLRMHPGPDIREFRCTGRLFDFSAAGSPVLRIELDMP